MEDAVKLIGRRRRTCFDEFRDSVWSPYSYHDILASQKLHLLLDFKMLCKEFPNFDAFILFFLLFGVGLQVHVAEVFDDGDGAEAGLGEEYYVWSGEVGWVQG